MGLALRPQAWRQLRNVDVVLPMRVDEFLVRMAQLVSEISHEAAGVDVMQARNGDKIWWVTITTPVSDYSEDMSIRRIATFDVVNGMMCNVKPLGDASVRDWQKVQNAL